MSFEHLLSVRYAGDVNDAEEINGDEHFQEVFKDHRNDWSIGSVRKNFLADAVRIDRNVLPELDEAIDALTDRLGLTGKVECYVHGYPMIQAGVARSSSGFVILLASAAVEKLQPKELEFVIGHEIGHVVYGHLEVPVGSVLENDRRIQAKHAMRLLSWNRKKEISADRAGLVCCGSLDAAASALFKTASGLSIPNLKVNPLEFGAQFDALQREIFRDGAEEMGMWTLSHPLVPLRMKSLSLFWQTDSAAESIPEAPGGKPSPPCDREIGEMLAHMDPLSQRGDDGAADPMLKPFLTWGGLYIAGASGSIDQSEHRSLAGFVGESYLKQALAGPKKLSHFREQIKAAIEQRQRPLSALDINRVFTCLIAVARADGGVQQQEIDALHELAESFGVAPAYVDSLLDSQE